jgi:biotin operon repressor
MSTELATPPATAQDTAAPQNPVSIRGALNGLRTILLEQISEHERAIIRAQQGLQYVAQIEATLGYEVVTPVAVAPAANGNGNGNGNGHHPEAAVKTTRSEKAQKIIDGLSPQKKALVKCLEKRGENFTSKETIADKLELTDPNQVGAIVSNTKNDGVDIESAFQLRRAGDTSIADNVQGFRLGKEFRLS